MAVEAGRPAVAGQVASVSPFSHLYGFGSVYAKTIRDSRLAFIIVAGLLAGIMVAGLKAFGPPTPRPLRAWTCRISSTASRPRSPGCTADP